MQGTAHRVAGYLSDLSRRFPFNAARSTRTIDTPSGRGGKRPGVVEILDAGDGLTRRRALALP